MFTEIGPAWNILLCCAFVWWIFVFFVLLGPCLMLLSRLQRGNRSRIRIPVGCSSRRRLSISCQEVSKKRNHHQSMKRFASTSALDALRVERR